LIAFLKQEADDACGLLETLESMNSLYDI